MALSLTLIGTGTPSPLLHRAGSSYLVETGDTVLLFDCGPGSVRRLLRKGLGPDDVTHLFLTHLHYDHCVDYPYLVLSRWDQGTGKIPELDVCGPAPLARTTDRLFATDGAFGPDLEARTRHEGSEFIYEMRGGVLPRQRPVPNVTEVGHGDTIEGEDWHVTVAEVIHVQPYLTCLAYRLDVSDTSIVFGGGTASIDTLTELARDADVLLHMCHMMNGVVTDPRLTDCYSGHLDAARTALDAGAQTLVLVHITNQMEGPGVRERILPEVCEIYDGNVVFGEDLMEIPIGGVTQEEIR